MRGRLTQCPSFRWRLSSGLGQGTGCGAETQQGTRGSWLCGPPCTTATLCPPVASTEGAVGGRRAGCTDFRVGRQGLAQGSRDPDLQVLSFSASSALGRQCSPNLPPPSSLGVWPSPCELEACLSLATMDRKLSGRWQGQVSIPTAGRRQSTAAPGSAQPGERGSWTRSRREEQWAVPA